MHGRRDVRHRGRRRPRTTSGSSGPAISHSTRSTTSSASSTATPSAACRAGPIRCRLRRRRVPGSTSSRPGQPPPRFEGVGTPADARRRLPAWRRTTTGCCRSCRVARPVTVEPMAGADSGPSSGLGSSDTDRDAEEFNRWYDDIHVPEFIESAGHHARWRTEKIEHEHELGDIDEQYAAIYDWIRSRVRGGTRRESDRRPQLVRLGGSSREVEADVLPHPDHVVSGTTAPAVLGHRSCQLRRRARGRVQPLVRRGAHARGGLEPRLPSRLAPPARTERESDRRRPHRYWAVYEIDDPQNFVEALRDKESWGGRWQDEVTDWTRTYHRLLLELGHELIGVGVRHAVPASTGNKHTSRRGKERNGMGHKKCCGSPLIGADRGDPRRRARSDGRCASDATSPIVIGLVANSSGTMSAYDDPPDNGVQLCRGGHQRGGRRPRPAAQDRLLRREDNSRR